MEQTKQYFREFIRDKNLRYTFQRDLIIECLYANPGHFTSDEFYDVVKKDSPEMGKATIYRTFKLLAEAGITARVDFGDGSARYELCTGRDHHDHLICEKCRESVEVVDPDIEILQEKLVAKHDFKYTRHRLYLYGICSQCNKK